MRLMTLGARLRFLRVSRGLTLAEASDLFTKKMGVKLGASALSMYEREQRSPDIDNLGRLAAFYEATMDFMMGRSDEPEKNQSVFSERLIKLRTDNCISQSETAEALNMSEREYADLEVSTRSPIVQTVSLIAKHYDVTMDYLIGRTDNKKATSQPEDGFSKNNDEFKNMQEVMDYLKAEMIKDGLIKENDPLPLEAIKMLYKIASPAIKLLMDKSGTSELK